MPMNTAASDRATQETLTDVHRWTDMLFTIKTTRPVDYRFTPGQYARLGLEIDSTMVWRAYSIVSTPADDYLEYYGVLVPDGTFTPRLTSLNPGDTIWTEKQPYGFMTAERFTDGEHLWMLATGTGIGPFISILRDPAVWNKFTELVLVHCVRRPDEFAYQDELQAMIHTPPHAGRARLRYIRSATRDNETGPDVMTQRITTLLENGELEDAAGLEMRPDVSRVMLCGNPQMIEDTRKLLHARDMRPVRRLQPGQFITENYW
jgi:ferredoxin--NADP+ reductase